MNWGQTLDPTSGNPYWHRGSVTQWDPPIEEGTVFVNSPPVPLSALETKEAVLEAWRDIVRIFEVDAIVEDGDRGDVVGRILRVIGGMGKEALSSIWVASFGGFWLHPQVLPGGDARVLAMRFVGGLWFGLLKASTLAKTTGIVVCSVFRFSGAYRDTSKYARGLLELSSAVALHLPGFRLVVMHDDTLLSDAGAVWRDALRKLDASPHVARVLFACALARDHSGFGGHVDLFGTMPRFGPLFALGWPTWVVPHSSEGRSEGVGKVRVLVTDTDFKNLTGEHVFLRAAAFATTPEASEEDVICVSSGGSIAPRHLPRVFGLPALIANCIIGNAQGLPGTYWTDFLSQTLRASLSHSPMSTTSSTTTTTTTTTSSSSSFSSSSSTPSSSSSPPSSPPSSLAARYFSAVHSEMHRGKVYARRNIGRHRSLFPFGVDEFFLTTAVLARAAAAGDRSRWLFVVVAPPDRVLGAGLRLVEESGGGGGGGLGGVGGGLGGVGGGLGGGLGGGVGDGEDGGIGVVLEAAAEVAGRSVEEVGGRSVVEVLEMCRKAWPDAAAARVRLRWCDAFDKAVGLRAATGEEGEVVREGLCKFQALVLETMAAGTITHSPLDMELAHAHLDALTRAHCSKGLITARAVTLGKGTLLERPAATALSSILHHIATETPHPREATGRGAGE